MKRLRIFTWHVHGNYLYYLSRSPHDFFLPVRPGREHPYGGRTETFPFGDNVQEVPIEDVASHEFDLVLFQTAANYLEHQHEVLSPEQRRLPAIFLEHDPPRFQPTDTRHCVDDPAVTVVHVTAFNRLMWDNGDVPTRVIEHGVLLPPDVGYTGELPRGLVAVNNLGSRGRRLGLDVFERARECVPLDLVGMGSEALGGLGEVRPMQFPAFAVRYRFFFHPVRYTSLGLALCEAMSLGMPIIGLATTELPTVVRNGESGYIDTEPDALIDHMQRLIEDREEAQRLGAGAREVARARFGIERFVADWDALFRSVVSSPPRGEAEAAVVTGERS